MSKVLKNIATVVLGITLISSLAFADKETVKENHQERVENRKERRSKRRENHQERVENRKERRSDRKDNRQERRGNRKDRRQNRRGQ